MHVQEAGSVAQGKRYAEPSVVLIDDDEALHDALRSILCDQSIRVHAFRCALDYLALYRQLSTPGCIVCEVCMPHMSGLELQAELEKRWSTVPLVLITGRSDVKMAVKAVKAGAHDFLEKPICLTRLTETIQSAVDQTKREIAKDPSLIGFASGVAELSERQRQVMKLTVGGLSNKEIANSLRMSSRTVETHRAWVMAKTGARNLADLVQLATQRQNLLPSNAHPNRSVGRR